MDTTQKEKDFNTYEVKEYDNKLKEIVEQDGVWYKAKTKKGDFVHILVLKVRTFSKQDSVRYPHLLGQKMVIYLQGDKIKMDRFDIFYRGVEAGDLEPLKRDQVDLDRLSEGAFVLEALARGVDLEELMEATKHCSLGQITESLFQVGGQYRRNM